MKATPDFLRPVRGPHRLAWAALAVAVLVLGVAALDAWGAWQARAQAQAEATAAERALAGPARPAARPAGTERERGVRRVAARLARPWPALFSSIEGVQLPGVAWLALEVSDSGSLRLEGQAPDAATALAAAEVMKRDPLWSDVLVSRIEKGTAAGAAPRFVISATPRTEAW